MFLKDTIYYAFIKGLGIIFWIILLKLNSIYLDPIDFGNFSISLNIAITVSILITGWQVSSFLRFYHECGIKIDLYSIIINELIKTFTYMFIFWCILLLSSFLFFNLDYFKIIFNAMLLSLSYGSFIFMITVFRIKRELKQYLLYTLIYILLVLLGYFILINKFGWQAGLMSMSFAYIVVIIFYSISKKIEFTNIIKNETDHKYKKRLFKYGIPIVLIGVSSQLLSTSDILILKYYGFNYEVGIYSANYNIAEKSIFAMLSIMVAAFTPLVFKKSREKNFDVFKEIRKVNTIFLFVAIPIVIFMFYFAEDISILFLDKRYISGYYIIPFVSLAGIFVGIASFYSEVLTVNKMTSLLAKFYVIAMLTNIILNIIFVKEYGMLAAVISTIISYFLLMILIVSYAKRYYK